MTESPTRSMFPDYPSYHYLLNQAREKVRMGNDNLSQGLEILQRLREQYPHVPAIGHELVLAYMEDNQPEKAVSELEGMEKQFIEVDEETLCRRGRLFKDLGDTALSSGKLEDAEAQYRRAIERYGKAYEINHDHYPGVNQATLLLILAAISHERGRKEGSRHALEQMEQLAKQLLSRRYEWKKTHSDDNVWHPATRGELYLLRQDWESAADAYQEAFEEPNAQLFHRESAGKQVKRILAAWKKLGVEPDDTFTMQELFSGQ